MSNNLKVIISVLIILAIAAVIFFGFTPAGKRLVLGYDASMKKASEVSYETKKSVEDTCRSMISSYKADVDIYNLYKESDNINQKNYADAALIRAIQTANQYNEYVLKNSYVWGDNVPVDIALTLPTNIK